MNIRLHINDDNRRWDGYVTRDKRCSFFHQWAYCQVVARTFGHRPYYLSAWKEDEIHGILPLFSIKSRLFGQFIVSLPFVDYGGICADSEEAEQALLKEAVQIAKQQRIQTIELRHQYHNTLDLLTQLNKVNMALTLDSGAEIMWKRLHAKVRNQVRKARKSGLTFDVGGLEKLEDFYCVWSRNMRDLGTPSYPRVFFKNFLKAFPDSCEILLVKHDKKPVGTGIAVYFKNTMEVPWASSLRKYFSYCPNNLLYWGAIQRACERGCQEFHFGRSTKNSGNYRFKKQWGAKDKLLYYQYWLAEGNQIPDLSPLSLRYKLAVALWRRLPVAVANMLGPSIVRGIP